MGVTSINKTTQVLSVQRNEASGIIETAKLPNCRVQSTPLCYLYNCVSWVIFPDASWKSTALKSCRKRRKFKRICKKHTKNQVINGIILNFRCLAQSDD